MPRSAGPPAILIFSDPADDGFAKGDVYPARAISSGLGHSARQCPVPLARARRSFDAVRSFGQGSEAAADRSRINGFPLGSSDWEKTTGLKRDDYFATIPCLPISYDTAHEILKLLAGANVPAGLARRAAAAVPRRARARRKCSCRSAMDYQIRTIWNVIATIPGTVEPDRWVMIGNHRDAWVYGAVDPGSGTAATLEMCRALGAAVKNGWKPRRTLLYASWDAEEYGLVGSTEWAEQNASSINEKAVLMLNVDSAVSGPEFEASGVPSLRELVLDAAGAIIDPRTGKSLRSAWTEAHRATWAASAPLVLADPVWDAASRGRFRIAIRTRPAPAGFFPQMGSLGSGSDFTAFLDHLAVPAIDVGFKGGYGVYHSIYDDFNWMEKFGDPEFLTHATAARLYTLIAMRAAAADVVPFKFVPYGLALREHVDELRLIHAQRVRKADPARPNCRSRVRRVFQSGRGRSWRFRFRPRSSTGPPRQSAERDESDRAELAKLNDSLAQVERAFLLEKGLPDRPWFKHAIYAPGLTTGYAAGPCRRSARPSKKTTRRGSPPTCRRPWSGSRRRPPPWSPPASRPEAAPQTALSVESSARFAGSDRPLESSNAPTDLLSGNEQRWPRSKSRIASRSRLPRVLGPVAAFCVVVGSVIGSGIFLVPAKVATNVPFMSGIVHGLGHRRALQRGRGAHARRAGRDAASSRRPLRLPARGLWRTAGVPVRLGRVPDRAIRVDGDAGRGLRALLRASWCRRPSLIRNEVWQAGAAALAIAVVTAVNVLGTRRGGTLQVVGTILESRRRAGLDRSAISPGRRDRRQPHAHRGPAPSAGRSSRG